MDQSTKMSNKFMSRYIDADALVHYANNQGGDITANDIMRFPTADVEPVKHWISVKERLPENDGLYIVCKTIGAHQICFAALWRKNKWISVVKENQLDYVTHY